MWPLNTVSFPVQIVAASDVPKGAEIHNTYGELGNADLVSKYGFALSDNPFSAVILDKASLLQAAEGMLGVREMRLRSRGLRKERCGIYPNFALPCLALLITSSCLAPDLSAASENSPCPSCTCCIHLHVQRQNAASASN